MLISALRFARRFVAVLLQAGADVNAERGWRDADALSNSSMGWMSSLRCCKQEPT